LTWPFAESEVFAQRMAKSQSLSHPMHHRNSTVIQAPCWQDQEVGKQKSKSGTHIAASTPRLKSI